MQTLVQSAFDGYNVCICAYGQTGSGKTHTIIGEEDQPGLAPRTFQRIFQLANEHQALFDVQVSCSMLELYNDRLIDLIRGDHPEVQADRKMYVFMTSNNRLIKQVKLEIKKDKRGIVWVQGSRVAVVQNAGQLSELFRRGLQARHTGSTRMNDRSSRSHLIVAINIIVILRLFFLHGIQLKGFFLLIYDHETVYESSSRNRSHRKGKRLCVFSFTVAPGICSEYGEFVAESITSDSIS